MVGDYYTALPACLNCRHWLRCEIKMSFGWCNKGILGSIKCNEFSQSLVTYYTNVCDEWEDDRDS